eukprot:CAMPEP_0184496288 /NCGR_PEP_ID=MMETSP0113_2-20130426/33584_1 /TAXON_ID=91329 /ORGANISM="Norrisiella sphaerica, Strain BC52" /LENGTH=85 /DNA_ID=CAMNT_0026882849 /DNA_START=266 /DNA_END=523 /DNA_ORIENTATION=-
MQEWCDGAELPEAEICSLATPLPDRQILYVKPRLVIGAYVLLTGICACYLLHFATLAYRPVEIGGDKESDDNYYDNDGLGDVVVG